MRTSIAGLLLAVLAFTACSGSKKNCAVDTDCGNGQFCAPAGCTWGCFQEGVGCREGGWCHPVSGQCLKTVPEVSAFMATPSTITRGESSTLEWSVLGADTLTIEPDVGTVSGTSTAVSPTKDTTYTLSATNASGTIQATTTVIVPVTSCDVDAECLTSGAVCNTRWRICVTADCTGKADFTPCNLVTDPDFSYDICVDNNCVSPGTCGDTKCNAPGPNFLLADTNQRKCYDATTNNREGIPCPSLESDPLYGQDWQYGWDSEHPEDKRFAVRIDVPDEPVVMDAVTGLVWRGCVQGLRGTQCDKPEPVEECADTTGKKCTWQEALVYCDNLLWGDFSDWRMPNIHELDSIVDAGRYQPDPTQKPYPTIDPKFPATPLDYFWSSSSFPSPTSFVRIVSFSTGDVEFNQKGIPYYVRCVRGEP